MLLHQLQHRKTDSSANTGREGGIFTHATLGPLPNVDKGNITSVLIVRITLHNPTLGQGNTFIMGCFICRAVTYVDCVRRCSSHHLNVNSQMILRIYQYARRIDKKEIGFSTAERRGLILAHMNLPDRLSYEEKRPRAPQTILCCRRMCPEGHTHKY